MDFNLSMEKFAEKTLDKLEVGFKKVAFGLSEEVRKRADERISFSRMTFTHQMIRLLLVEQIYRAFKISRGEKYHW